MAVEPDNTDQVDVINLPCRNQSCACTDNSTSVLESQDLVSLITDRFVPFVFCLISVLGIVGNIVVVIVALSSQLMRNTTNVLIANLATADLIFIVICVPFTAVIYAMPIWPFGNAWCKIYQYLIYATTYVSVYTLVLMSLDRYMAVVHPVWSLSIRTERNAYLVSTVLWTVVLIFNVPTLIDSNRYDYLHDDEMRSICINVRIWEGTSTGNVHGRFFFGCFFVFGYALPLVTVCILYGLMLRRLLQGSVNGRSGSGSQRMRSNRRVTRMIVIVVIAFALCWLPFHLVTVVQHFGPEPTRNGEIFIPMTAIVTSIAYLNSCVNPVLYAFLSENFRRSFRRVLGTEQKRARSGECSDKPTKPFVQTSRAKEEMSLEVIPNT